MQVSLQQKSPLTNVYHSIGHNTQAVEQAWVPINRSTDCGIYIMECSVIKNKIMAFAGKWLELEIIVLSKISQTQTNIACFLSYADSRF
jgi:hypothetical protein